MIFIELRRDKSLINLILIKTVHDSKVKNRQTFLIMFFYFFFFNSRLVKNICTIVQRYAYIFVNKIRIFIKFFCSFYAVSLIIEIIVAET